MPTPYEEISNNYARVGVIKADANLSKDSEQLGGIDAEEYATKKYVQDYVGNQSKNDRNYTQGLIDQLKEDLQGYTDKAIGDQDFTDFVKRNDLQVVQEKLEENLQTVKTELEENIKTTKTEMQEHCEKSCTNTLNAAKQHCEESCKSTLDSATKHCEQSCQTSLESAKEYTDTEVGKVSTANQNTNNELKGVKEQVQGLNTKYDELFQSVSDGKAKVAEAITDKGVPTSATDTFSQMANNVRNIDTSGSGGGGIDTSDATATPSTILRNYTAYAKGEKITGTYVPPVVPGIPTYGTDTSDGNAGANDVRKGKIAYANGQRIVGTLVPNTITYPSGEIIPAVEVEEIHNLQISAYDTSRIMNLLDSFEEGEKIVEVKKLYAVGISAQNQTNKYSSCIVRAVQEENGGKYFYSNKISNGKIIVQKSNSDTGEVKTKKFRYSYDELNLPSDCHISQIVFGAPGYGNPDICLMGILWYLKIDGITYFYIDFYRYSLIDASIIIETENNVRRNPYYYEIELNYGYNQQTAYLTSAKLSPNVFAYKNGNYVYLVDFLPYYESSNTGGSIATDKFEYRCDFLEFVAGDTLLHCKYYDYQYSYNYDSETFLFIQRDEDNLYKIKQSCTQTQGRFVAISDDGTLAYIVDCRGSNNGLYKVDINYNDSTIKYTLIKSNLIKDWSGLSRLYLKFSKNNRFIYLWNYLGHTAGGYFAEISLIIDSENSSSEMTKVIVNPGNKESNTYYDFIDSEDNSRYYVIPKSYSGDNSLWSGLETYPIEVTEGILNTTNEVLGIKYKNQIYYSPRGNNSKLTEG